VVFVYVFILLVALWKFAEWVAPWHDLSEAGCVLGYVYDGDTVELKCGGESRTTRLVGFDTPETTEPGCAEEAALGRQATLRLRELVASGPVTLDGVGRDKYGRLLATLSVNGRDVGETLIEAGLAVAYRGGSRVNWCERLAR